MQGEQVRNEHISTPRGYHVTVEKCGHRAPKHRTILDRFDPQIEGKYEQKDGNGLIVITSSHRTGNVTRRYAHEGRGQKTGGWRSDHFGGQKIGCDSGQAGKGGRKEDTNVANVDGKGQKAEEVVNDATGYHQARVECSTSDSSKGMPCSCMSIASASVLNTWLQGATRAASRKQLTVIEPVPEAVESMFYEVFRRSKVEPRINCIRY